MTKEPQERANAYYLNRFDDELRALVAAVDDYTEERYDDALQQLEEMPLSFEKVTTHHRDETIEWEILLGTGGPADRILVTTDYAGNVQRAEWQFQDWFEPWTAATNQDYELVERFAEIVGYYEDAS